MKIKSACVPALWVALASAAFAQSAPKPLAGDFDILNRKSIFSRDRVVHNNDFDNRNNRRDQHPAAQKKYVPIFIGVLVQDDGSFVGFIADPDTGQLSAYRIGDALPFSAGTIKDLSLDDMSTLTADHVSHKIVIGETILGGAAEYPAPPAPPPDAASSDDHSPPAPSPDSNAEPGAPDAAPTEPPPPAPAAGATTGRQPGEDILTYMKRRHAEQTGGK